ncbi:MAG: winged helix-turn-helix domain-containing protein [Dehalococcoidia bacterium]
MVASLAPGTARPRIAVAPSALTAVVVSPNGRPSIGLQRLLLDLGAHVTHVSHPAEAGEELERARVDLVFLVVGRGWESQLRKFRLIRELCDTPIVVIGDQGTVEQRIMYFDVGADDVLQLDPYPAPETGLRLRALVRLYRRDSSASVIPGPAGLVLDIAGRTAFVNGVEVALTAGEYELLALLLERRGRAVPVSAIAAHVSGTDLDGRRNHLEALVSRLRVKLRAAGADDVVRTVRRIGYRIG